MAPSQPNQVNQRMSSRVVLSVAICTAFLKTWAEHGPRTTAIGTFSPHGDSYYGCSDMVGNVSEWTNSLFLAYPYSPKSGVESRVNPNQRCLRGGDWATVVAQSAMRHNPPMEKEWQALWGFRVALSSAIPKAEDALVTRLSTETNANKGLHRSRWENDPDLWCAHYYWAEELINVTHTLD